MTCLDYWREYSDRVSVPVMHALAEFDGLWTYSREILESYKGAFPARVRQKPQLGANLAPNNQTAMVAV